MRYHPPLTRRLLHFGIATLAVAVLGSTLAPPAAFAVVAPGASLNYDAADDDGSDNVWENTGTTSGRNVTGMVNYTFGAPTTALPGISQAYTFAAGGGDLQTLDGLDNNQSASFEIWFRPSDLVGDERLFETGGGNGIGITLGGGTAVPGTESYVYFSVTQNSGGSQTARVSYDLSGVDTTEFVQVVGTFDASGNGTAELYVNGASVGTNTASAAITDWSGGDAAGVGILGGSNQGGYSGGGMGFSDYSGEIAIFRFYQNTLLSANEVAGNYNAIAGTPVFFDDDSTDGTWENDDNWGPNPSARPAATQDAYVGGGLSAEITQAGATAADVYVGHNDAGFNPGAGSLTINDPAATLTATRLRIGVGGEDGSVDFVTGTLTLSGDSSEQSLYVGQDNGSTGTFTMGTLGGNDAETTLIYDGGRIEVAKNAGSTGTFTLNSGTVTGTQNFIVTQGNGTAYVNIHGGSLITTTDMNFNSGNGYYTQDGGFVSVRDLQQSNSGSKESIVTVTGGTLEVRDDLNERSGTSTVNLGGTGRLELTGNSTNRQTENFNQSGSSVLKFSLYNNTTGVSAPLDVTTLGTFADTPTIELENRIPDDAGAIVDWDDGTGTWDDRFNWSGDATPANGANTIAAGTPVAVITSPNAMTTPGVLSSGTAGWTVSVSGDLMTVSMVNADPVGGPATARIQGATSNVTRGGDLRLAKEQGADAAGLILDSDASLTLTGASKLIIGGGATATVDHDGGVLNVGGDLLFGGPGGSQGGVYNLNGGSLTVGGDIVEGDSGAPDSGVNNAQLQINGGTLSVAGDITVQRFSIGEVASSSGATYTVPSGQKVHSTGTTTVGSQGTNASLVVNGTLEADGNSWVAEKTDSSGMLTVNSGGSVTTNNAWEVGDAAGAIGEVLLDGGTFTANKGWTNATNATSQATVTAQNGAELNVSGGNFETAATGTGVVNWYDGTFNQINNNLIVGQNAGSNATFEMYGGELNVVASGGQIRVANKPDTVGNFLLYGGTVNVGGQMDTFTNASGTNTSGAATIVVDDTQAGSNAPAVLNIGSDLVLGGANVTGGDTQMDIVSGTVNVGGNLELASGGTGQTAVLTLSGGTLDLSGGNVLFGPGAATFTFTGGRLEDVGTFDAALTQQGGTLAPGASPGVTTINGDYVVQNGGVLEIEFDAATTAGSGFDQLVVNGLVDLQDARLDVILGYVPTYGEEIVIVDNDGTDAVIGLFKDDATSSLLAQYDSFFVDNPGGYGSLLTISYIGGDGNDITLTAVPEPSTVVALLGMAALGLLGWWRRRRAWRLDFA